MKKAEQTIKEKILAEYKKGNIVVSTFEGLMTMPLKECIKQPDSGLLYDLNRDAATILTFIDDPKWINDYALLMVVIELKKQINDLSLRTSKLEKDLKDAEAMFEKMELTAFNLDKRIKKLEELAGLYEQRIDYMHRVSMGQDVVVSYGDNIRQKISELRKELEI